MTSKRLVAGKRGRPRRSPAPSRLTRPRIASLFIPHRFFSIPFLHSASYAWAEDKEHCEEYGRMLNADASKVSARARKRGLPQLGTLGAGNHYAEIQIVEEINDPVAAKKMGIDRVGQVCVMIHSGSRGLGHQVATDALVAMEKAMKRDGIEVNDRQVRGPFFLSPPKDRLFSFPSPRAQQCLHPPPPPTHSWPAPASSRKKAKTTLLPWLRPPTTPGSTAAQ